MIPLLFRNRLLGKGLLLVLGLAWAFGGNVLHAQTRIVPAIGVVETYDSNIFFTPKSQLMGRDADDFITTVTPQILFSQSGRLIDANLSVGVLAQKFAKNSELDNVGFNASAGLDFSRFTNKFLPRMRSLQAQGTYLFTPNAAGFGLGGAGFGGGIGAGGVGGVGLVGAGGFANSGQIAQRIRSTMYTVGMTGSYALSPRSDFLATYQYSKMSFGGSLVPDASGQTGATAINTTGHTFTAGPTTRISPTDTIGVSYTFSQFLQDQFGDFSTHAGTVNWGRTWSRELTSSLSGGLVLLEPFTRTTTTTTTPQGSSDRIPATIFPTGTVNITYASGSAFLRKIGSELGGASSAGGVGVGGGSFLPALPGMIVPGGVAQSGSYTITLNYTVSVFPSFVAEAGPIYTHLVNLGSTVGLSDRLSAFGFLNFAHSNFTVEANNASFDTYGTTVGANYLIARNLRATLSHSYLRFETSGAAQVGGISSGALSFGKHIVLLGLTYAFSPRGNFFQSGAFWESGGPSITTPESGPSKTAPEGVGTKK